MVSANLESELQKYDDAFRGFVDGYRLPKELFKRPDHFAIKCANEANYLEVCDLFLGEANHEGMWELQNKGRLLASAKLFGIVALGGYEFGWVEVMQPRPGKETDAGFVEHTEFHYPDFFKAQIMLEQKGVEAEIQGKDGHRWLNVVIDEVGREIKFNDKPLAELVVWEREQGMLRRIG